MKKRLQNSYEGYDPGISVRDGSWVEVQITPPEQKIHSFNADLVNKLLEYENLAGAQAIIAAIVLHELSDNIRDNKVDGAMNKMGITWVCKSLNSMANDTFTYMSKKQLEKIMVKLVDNGILKRGNFNTYAFDKTYWYTIWYNEIRILCGLPPLIFQRVDTEVE